MVCQWRKRLHEHEGATALECGARRNRDCCMDGGQPARENDILKREVQALSSRRQARWITDDGSGDRESRADMGRK